MTGAIAKTLEVGNELDYTRLHMPTVEVVSRVVHVDAP
jgi:hypothetical protein